MRVWCFASNKPYVGGTSVEIQKAGPDLRYTLVEARFGKLIRVGLEISCSNGLSVIPILVSENKRKKGRRTLGAKFKISSP